MTPCDDIKKLSVCLYVRGEQPETALRLLDTLRASPGLGSSWELLVGANTPRYDLREYISHEHSNSRKIIWIESGLPRHQSALWRALMSNSTATWILLISDHVSLDSGWRDNLLKLLESHHGCDVITLGADPATNAGEALAARGFLLRTSWLRQRLRDPALHLSLAHLSPENIRDAGVGACAGGEYIQLHSVLNEVAGVSDEPAPRISACLCTYGNHPELVLRCLDSILKENVSSRDMELLIGCNDVSREVMSQLERRALHNPYSLFIRSPYNLNKSGIQRLTFRLARAPLILSLDDDMYFLPGWFRALQSFTESSQPFDVAGRLHTLTNRGWWSGKKRPYDQFVRRKHWWREKTPHGVEVHFPAGQCFLAKRDFVLLYDYPDCGMKIDWDDVLLGDLVAQVDGTQLSFSDELTKRIVVDEIASRGHHGGG